MLHILAEPAPATGGHLHNRRSAWVKRHGRTATLYFCHDAGAELKVRERQTWLRTYKDLCGRRWWSTPVEKDWEKNLFLSCVDIVLQKPLLGRKTKIFFSSFFCCIITKLFVSSTTTTWCSSTGSVCSIKSAPTLVWHCLDLHTELFFFSFVTFRTEAFWTRLGVFTTFSWWCQCFITCRFS